MKYLFLSAAPLIFPCMLLAQPETVAPDVPAPAPQADVQQPAQPAPDMDKPAPEMDKKRHHGKRLAKIYNFLVSNGVTHEQVVEVFKLKHKIRGIKKTAKLRALLEEVKVDAAVIDKVIAAKRAKMAERLERKLKKLDALKNAPPAPAPAPTE